ncbi:DMT family transporter [Stappia sp. F7233]|uniref:DMT family transporter n=1 Tax=Stappia albiluteola TaxID=2758565 RepID=A0A839AJL3_9HYPH|nr:DMT family transporter [Stappia albiluteola]MBA5778679.1 DMT family transporter [Stappia albiluteola]
MRRLLITLSPAIFVLLWSTGFIGSKLGAPYIEPFVFLSVRFLIVLPILLGLALLLRSTWPRTVAAWFHCLVAGALMHGVYLGGIFWAIDRGMPAGISALVLGLQPLLTAVIAAPILGERVGPRHWAGLAIGGAGLALVVLPKLGGVASGISVATVAVCLVAVVGMSAGAVYQKRFAASVDLLSGTALQYAGALMITLPLSAFESWQIEWSGDLVIALAWLVLVLSVGAILLLMVLIGKGSASRVAALFYLVPVATSVESYFLFGERLSLIQLAGMALVIGAMILIQRPGGEARAKTA